MSKKIWSIEQLRIGLPQVMALAIAIVGIAAYSFKIEAKANDAHTRVMELKAEVTDIKKVLINQQTALASLQADSRAILRTLRRMSKAK